MRRKAATFKADTVGNKFGEIAFREIVLEAYSVRGWEAVRLAKAEAARKNKERAAALRRSSWRKKRRSSGPLTNWRCDGAGLGQRGR